MVIHKLFFDLRIKKFSSPSSSLKLRRSKAKLKYGSLQRRAGESIFSL